MADIDKRKQYLKNVLQETEMAQQPLTQFSKWYQDARDSDVEIPNAMMLCTVNSQGQPSARIVLLKAFNAEGYVFYSNYHSRKGVELDNNPHVALVFWWEALERQIRIEGKIEKISHVQSDDYFMQRPLGSRIASIISEQSQTIASRQALEEKYQTATTKLDDATATCPEHWGGYIIKPHSYEFWQGREARLSDRLHYRLDENNQWILERLQP